MAKKKTPQEIEHYAELTAAVGALFLMWAQLESEMAASLRHFLTGRIRDRSKKMKGLILACAILGSMRLRSSRDMMKRIASELGFGKKALAFHEALFTHIAHIEDLRDRIAHQMTLPAHGQYDGVWKVTDIATTRALLSYKTYQFDTPAVIAAAHDLFDAGKVVGQFLTKGARRSAPQLPSWQYKPSMLKLQPDKKRPSPRSPKRPPESSRA